MPLQNLSLSNLYRATTGTPRSGAVSSSLNAANGMAGTPISMSSFNVNNVAVTMPFTYIVEGTSENVTYAFTGQGLAFDNRIKGIAANYHFVLDTDAYFTVGTRGQSTAIQANTLGTPPYSGSNGTSIRAYYEDGYNATATGNYGFINGGVKTIYSVDSYNSINSDILCVATDTQILLADGTSVEAGDLYVGDTIKTFVPEGMPSWLPDEDQSEWYWWYHTSASAGEIVDAPISNIYFSFIDQYVSINDGAIKTTHAHPFYAWDDLTNTYQFTRAEDVAEGDKLIKYNNVSGQIEEVEVYKIEFMNKTLEIATITVDVAHTFLANGFVSHNKGAANAPIPWNGLKCYLDPQFANSYNAQGQEVINDLAGYTTGFNLIGGDTRAIAAPTFNTSTPKSLTFGAGKYGIKQPFNTSGTNISNFNISSNTGMTIIAFLDSPSGTILENSSNFLWSVIGNYASMTGAYAAASGPQTSWSGWNMHAITAGNGTTAFYRNSGTPYASTSVAYTGGITVSSYELKLMTGNTGKLGSFLYYNRVLTSTEINAIYNNLKGRYGL